MEPFRRNTLRPPFQVSRKILRGDPAFPLHDHDFGEILIVDNGECINRVNEKDIPMRTGDICLLRPPDRQSLHSIRGRPFYIVNICFQWRFFLSLQRRHFPGDSSVYQERDGHPRVLSLDEMRIRKAKNLAIRLLGAPRTQFHIELFLMNLFWECGLMPEEQPFFPPAAPDWLRDAWRITVQGRNYQGGVKEFSLLCGRSPEHVSREFRRHRNQTLVSCLNEFRMAHAAEMLAGTSEAIVDIAANCGFESLSQFYACFRNSHGTTPRHYRLQSLNAADS